MDGHTRGKGPFAKRQRSSPPDSQAPRWLAPRAELTEDAIRVFLRFVRNRCDGGVFKLFSDLATMPPAYRLARNLSKLIGCMADHEVIDVLDGGMTKLEVNALQQLESAAIPVQLLGIAHELFDLRRRQLTVPRLDEAMSHARSLPVPISAADAKRASEGDDFE